MYLALESFFMNLSSFASQVFPSQNTIDSMALPHYPTHTYTHQSSFYIKAIMMDTTHKNLGPLGQRKCNMKNIKR
jgi:hypothetical protein